MRADQLVVKDKLLGVQHGPKEVVQHFFIRATFLAHECHELGLLCFGGFACQTPNIKFVDHVLGLFAGLQQFPNDTALAAFGVNGIAIEYRRYDIVDCL